MTNKDVQNLLNQYHVPAHVRLHSAKVAIVADFIGKKLIEEGAKIDLILLKHACLLHDLVRICDMKNFKPETFIPTPSAQDIEVWKQIRLRYKNQHHADAGSEILKQINEPAIGNLIFKHKFTRILDPEDKPKTWEEKLVYYADKRVAHGDIVSLNHRIIDGKKRNVQGEKALALSIKAEQKVLALEKEIFDKIKLNPEVVNAL